MFKAGAKFEEKITIQPSMLRSGTNKLTLQVFNRLGGRSDAVAIIDNPNGPAPRKLFGLPIGINNYTDSKAATGKRGILGNLKSAVNDATRQADGGESRSRRPRPTRVGT